MNEHLGHLAWRRTGVQHRSKLMPDWLHVGLPRETSLLVRRCFGRKCFLFACSCCSMPGKVFVVKSLMKGNSEASAMDGREAGSFFCVMPSNPQWSANSQKRWDAGAIILASLTCSIEYTKLVKGRPHSSGRAAHSSWQIFITTACRFLPWNQTTKQALCTSQMTHQERSRGKGASMWASRRRHSPKPSNRFSGCIFDQGRAQEKDSKVCHKPGHPVLSYTQKKRGDATVSASWVSLDKVRASPKYPTSPFGGQQGKY